MTPTALRPPAAIAILGAGNMGSGIAQACAPAGFEVRVRDVDDAAIQLGRGRVEKMLAGAIERKKLTPARRDEVLTRLRFTTGVGEAVRGAALVIEAVFEDVAVKRAAFADIAAHVGADVIVATNTSSLQVTELAKGFPHLERFAGLHFFYPAAINKLVEVIGGEATAPATRRELERFCYLLKKIPIDTADRAGFCVNRYFVPYLNEATRLAEEGVANLATIEEFRTANGPRARRSPTVAPRSVASGVATPSSTRRVAIPIVSPRKRSRTAAFFAGSTGVSFQAHGVPDRNCSSRSFEGA